MDCIRLPVYLQTNPVADLCVVLSSAATMVEVIQFLNTSMKPVITQVSVNNNIKIPLLSDLHSMDEIAV